MTEKQKKQANKDFFIAELEVVNIELAKQNPKESVNLVEYNFLKTLQIASTYFLHQLETRTNETTEKKTNRATA